MVIISGIVLQRSIAGIDDVSGGFLYDYALLGEGGRGEGKEDCGE